MIFTVCILTLLLSFSFEKYVDILKEKVIGDQWIKYIEKHNLNFSRDEFSTRFGIFKDNLKYIEYVNSQNKSYKLGVTRFSHMTSNEYKKYVKGSGKVENHLKSNFHEPFPNSEIYDIDYRKLGAVTRVKNQGMCGSCWAFSAIGLVESQNLLKTNVSKTFSEQQLIDCSRSYQNHGCDGGLARNGLYYINDNGIENDTIYPYKAVDQKCSFQRSYSELWVDKIYDVIPRNETDLALSLINIGPISVSIDASRDDFQFYSDGIYEDPTCSDHLLDHDVLLVGIGSSPSPHYIVKNSWGTRWGKNGYILMARNKNNMCGIATEAVFATVKYEDN